MFEPWMLAALEEEGYMDTSEGCINRVAKHLNSSPIATIGKDEFFAACRACGVDPYSFTQSDFIRLQSELD